MSSLSTFDHETIAAVVTAVAPAQGGVAIVRVSGPDAESVVKNVVSIPGTQLWESHRILYGYVLGESPTERLDEVLILVMKAPRSFTGEDVVEIHCHGGLISVQRVLGRVLSQPGIRRAMAGEFSQRAVLNGRLDLTSAEAINELISARSRRAAQLAMKGLDGGIQRRITLLRKRLLDQLSELDARVDFEEDLPKLDSALVLNELQAVSLELRQLIQDSERGLVFRKGLRVALIGRPNVGKSSLLNRLSGHKKAIVSDLPGTTRDLLESSLDLNGVPITLIDTAGIHETKDSLENLGIDRSYEVLLGADVVLLVFDLGVGWTKADSQLLEKIPADIPRLLIGNKVDLLDSDNRHHSSSCHEESSPDVIMSSLTGAGEENVIQAILKVCGATDTENLIISLNERQRDLALAALAALARVQEVANEKLPWDFWTIDLRDAIHSLGEVLGEEVTEAVLDRIFSRFCIGK